MRSFHSIEEISPHYCLRSLIALFVLAFAIGPAASQPLPSPVTASFTVFVKSVPVGTEQTTVTRGADGWTISSSGRMGAPVDLVARRVQVRYDPNWKPLELTIDATVRGQVLS